MQRNMRTCALRRAVSSFLFKRTRARACALLRSGAVALMSRCIYSVGHSSYVSSVACVVFFVMLLVSLPHALRDGDVFAVAVV